MTNLFLFFAFILGTIMGSFLNCLAWRLYHDQSMAGRSKCPHCHKQIAWYDNIPLLSFIILRGKCRHCRQPIAWQYPLMELACGLLFLGVMSQALGADNLGSTVWALALARDLVLCGVMATVFLMDLKWYVILDEISLPAAGFFLIMNLILGASWQNLLLAAAVGAGFFALQFLVSRGRWIGGGDIRLGLVMGLALADWQKLLAALFIAYFIGAAVGLILLASGKKSWGSRLPLGVFLAVGTVVVLFWGKEIIGWYVNSFSSGALF